jgi:hypothetical protein
MSNPSRPISQFEVAPNAAKRPAGVARGLGRLIQLLALVAVLRPAMVPGQPGSTAPSATNPPPMVLTVEGTNVWIQRFGSNTREAAYPAQILQNKDRGFTGARSRASVRLSDLSVARIRENSEFQIEPLPDPNVKAEFSLLKGLLYLLHRDKPGVHRFRTPTATAATRGTEFTLEVEEATGRTTLTVLEGEAELGNAAGSIWRSGVLGTAFFPTDCDARRSSRK